MFLSQAKYLSLKLYFLQDSRRLPRVFAHHRLPLLFLDLCVPGTVYELICNSILTPSEATYKYPLMSCFTLNIGYKARGFGKQKWAL